MYARHHAAPWLRVPSFAPALRVDLRFVSDGEHVVRLYEPTLARFVSLYRLECHLAQHMDGQRGLDEITAIAQRFNQSITREAVERLVVNLHSVGLLGNVEGHCDPDVLEWRGDSDGVPARAPILVTTSAVPQARPPVPALRVVDAVEAPTDDDEAATMIGAPVEADPDEASAVDEQAEAEAEAEADADAEAPSAADIAAQEQEELWNAKRARKWHQRRWVRVLGVLALVVIIAAIVPYPLRVTAECTLIPSERVKVRSELGGVLVEVLVDEGAVVKKGDVIARLDDRALKADRQKVLAEIEKIDAENTALRKGRRPEEIQQQVAVLAARRNEVAFAAKEAGRRAKMAREGVGSRQAADAARGELESRRKAVAEAEAALKLLKAGARPEEISAHEAVLKRARAELEFIDQKLAMTQLRAPIDGTVLTPRFRERVNEGIEVGGLVCEIANTRRMRAEIYMPEREVDTIALGMPATVKVESYPTRPFEGKVDFIAPSVEGKDRRIRVVVELDNEAGLLKANMTGYGEVEAGDRSLLHLATRRFLRWIRVRFLL